MSFVHKLPPADTEQDGSRLPANFMTTTVYLRCTSGDKSLRSNESSAATDGVKEMIPRRSESFRQCRNLFFLNCVWLKHA